MKIVDKTRGAILGLALTLAIAPLSLAHANTTSVISPFNSVEFSQCGAFEAIQASGSVHLVTSTTTDATGGMRVDVHSNYQNVSGVGETTGTTYRFIASNTSKSTTNGSASNYTLDDNVRVIGQGPNNNQVLHILYHVTTDAAGNVTAQTYQFQNACH